MDDDQAILSTLPDAPLTIDAVDALDASDSVREATAVMVRGGGGRAGPDQDHTDDVLLATADRIRYLSRVPEEGWSIEYSQSCGDGYDATFEEVLSVAQETAELKYQAQTEFEL